MRYIPSGGTNARPRVNRTRDVHVTTKVIGMRQSGYEQGARWLLLCLLLLGVVSMHHFMPPACHDHPAAMAAVAAPFALDGHPAQPPDCPAPDHEMSHLCAAVLGAVVSLMLIAFLLMMSLPVRMFTLRRPPLIRRAARPPDLSGRDLLSSVCVLRL